MQERSKATDKYRTTASLGGADKSKPVSATVSLLNSLNEQQRVAATTESNKTLVRAGAGTGKTLTIVARCAHLIESGVQPQQIQALTFTRKSAAEIKSRVENLLGVQAAGLNASTFHSWCMTLIRGNEDAWGYKGWTVIDPEDQLTIFKIARGRRELGLPPADSIMNSYSFARNAQQGFIQVAVDRLGLTREQIEEFIVPVVRDYDEVKRLNRYIDYDDVLVIVGKQLQASDELAEWIGKMYSHLLIDEMQDTNPLQWQILRPLVSRLSLYCVGDDAQSIYGFRGADFASIYNFQDILPGSKIYKLTDNYRSTQGILDISNWLLRQSPLSYDKDLVAQRSEESTPTLETFGAEQTAANRVIDLVEETVNEGEKLKDNLILVRASYIARAVEQVCLQREIPYRFYGGYKLLESAHIRDLLSALRIVANPLDQLAWLRYLMLFPKIGEVSAKRLMDEQIAHFRAHSDIDYSALPSPVADTLSDIRQHQHVVPEAITVAAEHLDPVLEKNYRNQNWDRRWPDFLHLKSLAHGHTSVAGFVEQYIIDPVFSTELTGEPSEDAVIISTIHSSKGMEANHVYLLHASPGQFPTPRAVERDAIEEERRLLYVALTRARDTLTITRLNLSNSPVNFTSNRNPDLDLYFFADLPDQLAKRINNVELSRPAPPSGIELPRIDLSVEL